MEVLVEHLGAVQFEIRARQHKIACDQPTESGGFDEGMTLPELLLATCAGFYAAQYLNKYKLASEGTRVRVKRSACRQHLKVTLRVLRVGGIKQWCIASSIPFRCWSPKGNGISTSMRKC